MATAAATTFHRLGPSSAGIQLSPEEFDALPSHRWVRGYRYELVNGVLVVSPFPGDAEVDPNDYLGYLLRSYQENHPQGRSLSSTTPERTVLSSPNRRRCDRAIWTGLGRPANSERDLPTIVVEFVSERKRDWMRDYVLNRDEYLALGIREYWVIDHIARLLAVHRSSNAGYQMIEIHEGEDYVTDLLPGFVLPLSNLLAKADPHVPAKRRRRRGGKPNP